MPAGLGHGRYSFATSQTIFFFRLAVKLYLVDNAQDNSNNSRQCAGL
jgi:hypothetical protein